MTFETLWPLLFLLAVPVIIILYLLKPKGIDYRISSNLLWDKLFKNQQSKTFFEKFVHNILMYLQILILLLLVLSLMSPYINLQSQQGGRVVFLLDTSASMQHDNGEGISRLEETVEAACDYVDASRDSSFSVITCDARGVELLAVGSADKGEIIRLLKNVTCSDAGGNLADAQGVVEALYVGGEGTDNQGTSAKVIVLTDATGAESATIYTEHMDADLLIAGDAVSNISNDFTVYSIKENGADVVTQVTNYSDSEIAVEVSLYEVDPVSLEESLLGVKTITVGPMESSMCLFQEISWNQGCLKSVVETGGGIQDSLLNDNVSYAVAEEQNFLDAVLVGSGNTYIERAYRAITGNTIAKVASLEGGLDDNIQMVIYDAGCDVVENVMVNRLCFGDTRFQSGTLNNVRITVQSGEMTAGLNDFRLGVNQVITYDVPEWGHSFMTYEGQCVGFYGEHDGIREVFVGFNIRESDFPLLAEFPIFMSNAVAYLSDASLLASTTYYAGERLLFHPRANLEPEMLDTDTSMAGLYQISVGDQTENYVVRMETNKESNGWATFESQVSTSDYRKLGVRKNIRNAFLGIALALLLLEWFLYLRQMNQLKKPNKFYLALRIISFVLLLLALFGFSIPKNSKQTTTIFLVDISASNGEHIREIEEYIMAQIDDMPKNNRYGIITFGRNAQIEQFVTENKSFHELMSVTDESATNIEEAIYRGLAMIPSDSAGRIVLLSDGKETRGNIANAAGALVANDVELLGLIYESEIAKDAYIEALEMPSCLHPGDGYYVTITVTSNYDTDGVLIFSEGEEEIARNAVHLNRGSNRFIFERTVTEESLESFQVTIETPEDQCEENNTFHAYAIVETAPKILVIAGVGENTYEICNLLTAAGCDYTVVSAKNAPDNLNDLLAYKNIILQNVFISDLPDAFLDNIESYVKDYGCGLVCCGGEDSFALGGYRDSVLEDILPVDMMLRGVNEIPSTAMVMIIDRSGSMSSPAGYGMGTNLDVAITATIEAVRQLRSEDYVGVVSFDDSYQWEVPLTLAEDKDAIIEAIESINDGGGTTIKPAVLDAIRLISACEVSVRHLILLTDGMGETTDFEDVINLCNQAGITLSTVAVGDGSDTTLLNRLALSCGGRYYYSDAVSDIPRIFAQEVFLSGDTYLQNGIFALQGNGQNSILNGLFPDGWPVLYGYVCSSPKSGSNVLLMSERQDPILTVWQYGLGKTVAWNTDVTGTWTGAFSGQQDYVQLWKNIVDYSSGNTSLGADRLDIQTIGDRTTITYEAEDYTEETNITAMYSGPDGATGEITLHAVAPGRYEADMDSIGMGIYQINVRRMEGDYVTNAITSAAAIQFADEYRFDNQNTSTVQFLDNYGKIVDIEENIWTKRSTKAREMYDLTGWILAVLIIWFLVEVALRRFQYMPVWRKQRKASKDEMAEKVQPSSATTEKTTVADSSMTDNLHGNDSMNGATKIQNPQNEMERIPKKKKEKKKSNAAVSQTLDTAQLLKKRDERNNQ